MQDGRIALTDAGWVIGDGKPVAKQKPGPTSRNFSVAMPKVGEKAQFDKSSQPDPAENVVKVGNLIVATKDSAPIGEAMLRSLQDMTAAGPALRVAPAAVQEQPTPPPAVEPPVSVFRCALWSDGVLELQRDGRSLVELTPDEGEHFTAFMRRFVGKVESSIELADCIMTKDSTQQGCVS